MDKKPEKQKKQPRKITQQYLENAALYYLQRHATSVSNFRLVMKRKIDRSCRFFQSDPAPFYDMVDSLAERYVRAGILNDQIFAEAKTSTLRRQGRSRQAITAKLRVKGLAAEEIEQALQKTDSEHESHSDMDAEMAAALKLARRKKLGPYRPQEHIDMKERQKEMAVMARAGFSFDVARRVLDYTEDMAD